MIEDVSPRHVWEALISNPDAVLCDVRTNAEWNMFPSMQPNPRFIEELKAAHVGHESHIYFICRSGARSMAAAMAAKQAGFKHVYNVKDGFEGPLDARQHRGHVGGWKAENLPWRQG